MFKIKSQLLLLLLFVASISSAQAGGLFVDVAYVSSNVQIAEQKFKPTLLQVGIGWQFTERFSLELMQASSQSEDTVATVDAEIETMSSVMLRYGSPVSGTVNVYMMVGHSDFDLAMTGVTVNSNENFAGTSWGFGFEERLSQDSDYRLHFDYIAHYKEDELTVDSIQLGLRYVF